MHRWKVTNWEITLGKAFGKVSNIIQITLPTFFKLPSLQLFKLPSLPNLFQITLPTFFNITLQTWEPSLQLFKLPSLPNFIQIAIPSQFCSNYHPFPILFELPSLLLQTLDQSDHAMNFKIHRIHYLFSIIFSTPPPFKTIKLTNL